MGRLKKKDKEDADKKIEDTKDLLGKVLSQSGGMDEIFEIIQSVDEEDDDELRHIPLHSLQEVKAKLSEKQIVEKDDGSSALEPIYSEEEKVKVIFGLLSEKGLNLLDYLEKVLSETGYNGKVLFSINETMSKTTEILRDIAEMQFRKAKLENERIHLQIQSRKADLKEREIQIKEKSVEKGAGGTQVIAVGNPAELLALMNGNKGIDDIAEAEVVEEDE